jgi:hypothetical protein
VFLCTCASDDIRRGLFHAVLARWLLEPNIHTGLTKINEP